MLVVAGADGFLGTNIVSEAIKRNADKILCLNHRSAVFEAPEVINLGFELTDSSSFSGAFDYMSCGEELDVVYLISAHNIDEVRLNPERALKINTEYYSSFLNEIKKLPVRSFRYSSSDTVYGYSPAEGKLCENAPVSPVNLYGRHKAEAEKLTLSAGFGVLRFPYLSGPSLNARKKHFYDEIVSSLSSGKGIDMLTDYRRSCISFSLASRLTLDIIKSGTAEPVINVCGDNSISKYELGLIIARYLGCEASLVRPVTKSQLGVFGDVRADEIAMDNSLLKKILGITGAIELSYD